MSRLKTFRFCRLRLTLLPRAVNRSFDFPVLQQVAEILQDTTMTTNSTRQGCQGLLCRIQTQFIVSPVEKSPPPR